jgi:hypothetical protein
MEFRGSVVYSVIWGIVVAIAVNFVIVRFTDEYRGGSSSLAQQIDTSVLAYRLDRISAFPSQEQ